MKTFHLLTLMLFSFSIVQAKNYPIRTAEELAAISLRPGDKVILKAGEWKNQRLVFKGKGTENNPITLTTEKVGSGLISGNSTLLIEGEWLIVDGLYFTNGYSLKEDVITFNAKASHCRLTNTAIVNFNPPDKTTDYRWISMNGFQNRVDHCWIEGKTHQATTLVVWLADKPNEHRIDHNYFGQRPDLGVNGGETIRIGTSTWSFFDSKTTVENNIFEHCNGELEIVSNKSCKNVLRNNLFYECAGTLTLRHGREADVYGNYFIGNGLPKTGGIRIICDSHRVHDNYLQNLTGTGVSAAVSLMDGLPNPVLTSHWQVKDAKVYNNVIVNCTEPLAIGAGKNTERYLPPLRVSIADNVVFGKSDPVKAYEDKADIAYINNISWGQSEPVSIMKGFVVKDPGLKKNRNGLYSTASFKTDSPFWTTEKIGPSWKQGLYSIKVNEP